MIMSKFLLVGDMHVKRDNIEESSRLVDWINSLLKQYSINKVIFLGDQYNDMGIVRAEVLNFWHNNFYLMHQNNIQVCVLTGNHDIAGDGITTPLYTHKDYITLVPPETIVDFYGLKIIGFTRDQKKFIHLLGQIKPFSVIVCHQEFNGAQYDNGMYAPHGIPLEHVKHLKLVISGHIHKKQQFANVVYVGTPRQLTKSEVLEVKGVHIFDLNTLSFEFIKTPHEIAEPYQIIQVFSGSDLEKIKDIKGTKTIVEIHGDKDFVLRATKEIDKHIPIKTIIKNKQSSNIKESDGIGIAFMQYVEKFKKETSYDPDTVSQAINLIIDQLPILRG